MRILLVGEYSNVHWTLATGLRTLGHDVTVVSSGDGWKDYPRDIDLRRHGLQPGATGLRARLCAAAGTLRYLGRLAAVWPRLRGYDVVQLINPVFADLRAERLGPLYTFLRRHNRRIVLGAFGIDHYWVRVGMDCRTFRYSDFNIGPRLRDYPFMHTMAADWLHGPKGQLNRRVAADADAIVAGLYEYDVCYRPFYPGKTTFIPFPIDLADVAPALPLPAAGASDPGSPLPGTPGGGPMRFFIGIQRSRSAYKGTDIMLAALSRLSRHYGPGRMEVVEACNVPYARYRHLMDTSHVLLDQLYSYTPAMNALLAMAKGLVVVGGGEEEHYALLGESELRPIVNVRPSEDDVCRQIASRLLDSPRDLPRLSRESALYVRRHHDHIRVARRYEALYAALL